MSTTTIDKKTGRRRAVNQTKSRTAKAAARKRTKKPMSAATKAKIAKAVRKAHRTGKTKAGRKVIKGKRMGTKKAA